MTDLLLVNASPRGELSESLRLAEGLLSADRAVSPGATLDRLDLAAEPLPPFDAAAVEAKMEVIAGRHPDGEAAAAWARITATFARLDAAPTRRRARGAPLRRARHSPRDRPPPRPRWRPARGMTKAWTWLLLAGLAEVAWSRSIRPTESSPACCRPCCASRTP